SPACLIYLVGLALSACDRALRHGGHADISDGSSIPAATNGGSMNMAYNKWSGSFLGRPLLLLVGLTLAGCQSQGGTRDLQVSNVDPDIGGQTNIGSLTDVVKRNPTDANGYNIRG